MNSKVVIIKIGHAGNLKSIERALSELKINFVYYNKGFDFNTVDKILLPGVGSYKDAMNFLNENLVEIKSAILNLPTLGICLGMQILGKIGFENGETDGIGLIDGEVIRMNVRAKTPHIGWSSLYNMKPSNLFKDINVDDKFYFMHTYELVNYTDFISLSDYEGHKFVSAINKGNLYGVQFHPEKSGSSGLKLLKNFFEME